MESEVQIIRTLLLNNELRRHITVVPDDFTDYQAKRMIAWMLRRLDAGRGVSIPELVDLHHQGKLTQHDVERFALDPDYPIDDRPATMRALCDSVKAASLDRALDRAIHEANDRDDPAARLHALLQAIRPLAVDRNAHKARPLGEVAREFYAELDTGVAEQVVSTGLGALDEILDGGFRAGEYILLAGRPSMGKSTLARQLAIAAARHMPVLFASAEDTAETFVSRAVSSESGVGLGAIRRRKMRDDEWLEVGAAVGNLNTSQLDLFTAPRMTVEAVLDAAMATDYRMVVVDYIGMLASRRDRLEAIGEASKAMKDLAKELGCPVVVVSQLNRKLEDRPNKRPQPADLRDSGDLEQDADTIMFVYRDEVYDMNSNDKGMAEIIVAKQRNGPAGAGVYVKVRADLARGRFGHGRA